MGFLRWLHLGEQGLKAVATRRKSVDLIHSERDRTAWVFSGLGQHCWEEQRNQGKQVN